MRDPIDTWLIKKATKNDAPKIVFYYRFLKWSSLLTALFASVFALAGAAASTMLLYSSLFFITSLCAQFFRRCYCLEPAFKEFFNKSDNEITKLSNEEKAAFNQGVVAFTNIFEQAKTWLPTNEAFKHSQAYYGGLSIAMARNYTEVNGGDKPIKNLCDSKIKEYSSSAPLSIKPQR